MLRGYKVLEGAWKFDEIELLVYICNDQVSVTFLFNNFLLRFKIKLTVTLARKHIIFYICVCV